MAFVPHGRGKGTSRQRHESLHSPPHRIKRQPWQAGGGGEQGVGAGRARKGTRRNFPQPREEGCVTAPRPAAFDACSRDRVGGWLPIARCCRSSCRFLARWATLHYTSIGAGLQPSQGGRSRAFKVRASVRLCPENPSIGVFLVLLRDARHRQQLRSLDSMVMVKKKKAVQKSERPLSWKV